MSKQSNMNAYKQKLAELAKQPATPETLKRIETVSRYRDLDLIINTAVALGMHDARGGSRKLQHILDDARDFLEEHNSQKQSG